MPNRSRPDDPRDSPRPSTARRFRPPLLPALAAIAAVAVFVTAGNWQRGRMQAKEALAARYEAAARLPPADLAELQATGDWAALRFRSVIARGEYDARHQILVDNKVYAGRAGFHVVTPLKFADGRAVLVDRGWTPGGPTRALLPDVPPPAGMVEVEGRLNVPPERYLELRTEASPGAVWQNLDAMRFARVTGVAVLPAIIEETAPPAPPDALVRDWPAPDFGIEGHHVYMIQWYALAALALTLWVAFGIRKRAAGKP